MRRVGEAGAQDHSLQGHLELLHHGEHGEPEPGDRGELEHPRGCLIERVCHAHQEGHRCLDREAEDDAQEPGDLDRCPTILDQP